MGRFLKQWEENIAAAALAVVFLAVVWGVFARYVSPRPAVWASEVAVIGFAWVVFLGAAAGARRGAHIGVDLLTALLPLRMQRVLAIAVSLMLAVVLAYIAWLAVKLGQRSLDRPTPVLRLPYTVVHAAAVLGFASMAISALVDAWRAYRGTKGDAA